MKRIRPQESGRIPRGTHTPDLYHEQAGKKIAGPSARPPSVRP